MVRNRIWGFLSRLWLGGGEQGSYEWLYPFHCPGCSQSRRVLPPRGASHAREICKTTPPLTHEKSLNLPSFQAEIASEIGRFQNLRRFYFQGPSDELTDEGRTAMITSTKAVAEACGQLTMVVDIAWEPRYVVARISRGENGEVASVDLGEIHYGMQIGNEDEAFP